MLTTTRRYEVIRVRDVMILCLAVALCCTAAAQTPVRVGDKEFLTILRGEDADQWSEAEATMGPDTKRLQTGKASHHFHIDVDFNAGEEAYPIGWPRTNVALKQGWQKDWSGYDCLRLVIYADTSRDRLPDAPLGLVLHTPDRARAYHGTLGQVSKGRWVTIDLPLSGIPDHDEVNLLQFFISESNYRDHDVVDFYIEDIALWRYAVPSALETALRPSIAFSDAASFLVAFRASGLPEGKAIQGTASLLAEGKVLLRTAREVVRGRNVIVVDLGGGAMPPGDYQVRLQLAGGQAQDFTYRIIESPWSDSL